MRRRTAGPYVSLCYVRTGEEADRRPGAWSRRGAAVGAWRRRHERTRSSRSSTQQASAERGVEEEREKGGEKVGANRWAPHPPQLHVHVRCLVRSGRWAQSVNATVKVLLDRNQFDLLSLAPMLVHF